MVIKEIFYYEDFHYHFKSIQMMLTELNVNYSNLSLTIVILLFLIWLTRVIYSIYFSPLSKIPSPWLYQLFPWYYNLTVTSGVTPFLLHELHEEYGPIFRVGWDIVIIVTPEACHEIYSNYDFTKGRLYDVLKYFGVNLICDYTREGHALRKRLVAPAYTKANVKLMEPVIKEVGLKPLLDNIENHLIQDKPIDLFHQFHYLSWDILGELGFGKNFNMLRDGDHPAVGWLTSTLNFTMLYYIFPFLKTFKVESGEKLREFNLKLLDEYYNKLDEDKLQHSLLRFLVKAKDKVTGNRLTKSEIFSETNLMLSAGTDTTSNTLTLLFHQLMKYPHVDTKLHQELCSLNLHYITNDICLDQCPYFISVIKEAIRLLPPAAGTPLRHVPNGGVTFLNHFIPAGYQVGVPLYAIQRSKFIWPRADQFLPERWLESDPTAELYVTPEMKQAFIPFLTGPRACVGKNLANLEINVIASNLLLNYRFLPLHPHQLTEFQTSLVALPILRPNKNEMVVKIQRRGRKFE